MMDAETIAHLPVKRGRGRPLGSRNKNPGQPRQSALSPEQRAVIKDELGAQYRHAVIARALAETQTRGLTKLIRNRLGVAGLAEIQAEVIAEQETQRSMPAPRENEPTASEMAA